MKYRVWVKEITKYNPIEVEADSSREAWAKAECDVLNVGNGVVYDSDYEWYAEKLKDE